MAKESKVITCSPDEGEINCLIGLWEDFGWELTENQRIQEFEKQTEEQGVKTDHYITFNRLTFQREKSADWYDGIVELENSYIAYQDELNALMDTFPKKRSVLTMPFWLRIPTMLAMLAFVVMAIVTIIRLLMRLFVIGQAIILLSTGAVIIASFVYEKIRYSKCVIKWKTENDEKVARLQNAMSDLRGKASEVVNAK